MEEPSAPSTIYSTREVFDPQGGTSPETAATRRLKQAAVLVYMLRMQVHDEEITVSTLCNRLNASRHLIGQILKSLQDRGFVTSNARGRAGMIYVCTINGRDAGDIREPQAELNHVRRNAQ